MAVKDEKNPICQACEKFSTCEGDQDFKNCELEFQQFKNTLDSQKIIEHENGIMDPDSPTWQGLTVFNEDEI